MLSNGASISRWVTRVNKEIAMLDMAKKGLTVAAVLAAVISSSPVLARTQGTPPGFAADVGGLYGECRQQVLSEWPPNSGSGFSSLDRTKESVFAACVANGGTLTR